MSRASLSDPTLTLRPWEAGDVDAIVECVDGDAEIARWLDLVPQPYSIADARDFVGGIGKDAFAIVDASTGRVLGAIGINPLVDGVADVGYWLRADARGRGVATRALELLSRWALDRDDVERVQLRADVENVPSCRVAERAGFRREGVLRSAHWNPRLGRRQDWAMYSLLPSDLA